MTVYKWYEIICDSCKNTIYWPRPQGGLDEARRYHHWAKKWHSGKRCYVDLCPDCGEKTIGKSVEEICP